MKSTRITILGNATLAALVVAAAATSLLLAAPGSAAPQYLYDGASQNADGGWDLPDKGSCGAGAGIATRPECIATRMPSYGSSATCTAAGGSWTTSTSAYCRDTVNTTAGTCVDTPGKDRVWNGAPDNLCVLTLKGYNRNQAVCEVQLGGVWSTWGSDKCIGAWIHKSSTDPVWDPSLLTGTTNPGPGDQCLRCHRSDTEWNTNRVRDVEAYVRTGHKNMARRVEQNSLDSHYGQPWGGPPFTCSNGVDETPEDCLGNGGTWDPTVYPSTDGLMVFDWPNADLDADVGAGVDPRNLRWIYGDWLAPLPRALYEAPASTSKVCTNPTYTTQSSCETNGFLWVFNAGMSYSCARCHTTGWTSDATIAPSGSGLLDKEPENSFPGITWPRTADATANVVNLSSGITGDANKYSSWDTFGIVCSRCHGSTIEANDPAGGSCAFTTSGSCTAAGGTWSSSSSSCSGANTMYTAGACAAAGGVWTAGNPQTAAFGRGATHVADLTTFDGINGGYCSNRALRNANKDTCEYFGGTWYSQCSDASGWTSARQCLDSAGCDNPVFSDPASCAAGGECSIPVYTRSATCTAGGGVWTAYSSANWKSKTPGNWAEGYCSVGGGVCAKPQYGSACNLSAPSVALGAAGTVTNGAHRVKVAIVTAEKGELPVSSQSSSLTVTTNQTINVTIPALYLPTELTCTEVRVYMTQAAGTTFYYAGSAGACNPTSTSVFNIDVSDDFLGAAAPNPATLALQFNSTAGSCAEVPAVSTDEESCREAGDRWASKWSNLFACMDAGGHWTGTRERRGQMITDLCMDCHRQETGGLPYDSTDPAGKLKVGPAHGTFDFVSHPHGNWFLNSPHAEFSGSYAEIGSAKFEYDMSGKYESWFLTEGEAANTGNGCTGCHNVHRSTVRETGDAHAIHEECTDCHAKNLGAIYHPPGKGTPLEAMAEEPAEACITCHMPRGRHLFRINPDPAYSTLPKAAITAQTSGDCTALGGTWSSGSSPGCTVNAPSASHDGYSRAVWVDVDMACGQCHGGGTQAAESTATTNPSNAYVTVADATGFLAGERIQIVGAGAVTYDDDGYSTGDFETYIKSIAGNQLNLLGRPALAVPNAKVIQNPTEYGAGYMPKSSLAALAAGIHNDQPVASFTYTLGNPNTLQVSFSAAGSTCGDSPANCDVFEWEFGDGATGSGLAPTHTYSGAGTWPVTLTVEQYGVGEASKTRSVTTYPQDLPPTISATCGFDANTWTLTITDTGSSDDHGLTQGVVNWGDGSLLSKDFAPPFGPFSHAYTNAGSFVASYTISDTVGQVKSKVCYATPGTFSIGGVVHQVDHTTGVGGVTIKVMNGATVATTVYTDASGSFQATNLKPATYDLLVTKSGWTFPAPGSTVLDTRVTVGPNDLALDIDATVDGAAPVPGRGKGNTKTKTTPASPPATKNR
jgi:hypothetical protein